MPRPAEIRISPRTAPKPQPVGREQRAATRRPCLGRRSTAPRIAAGEDARAALARVGRDSARARGSALRGAAASALSLADARRQAPSLGRPTSAAAAGRRRGCALHEQAALLEAVEQPDQVARVDRSSSSRGSVAHRQRLARLEQPQHVRPASERARARPRRRVRAPRRRHEAAAGRHAPRLRCPDSTHAIIIVDSLDTFDNLKHLVRGLRDRMETLSAHPTRRHVRLPRHEHHPADRRRRRGARPAGAAPRTASSPSVGTAGRRGRAHPAAAAASPPSRWSGHAPRRPRRRPDRHRRPAARRGRGARRRSSRRRARPASWSASTAR